MDATELKFVYLLVNSDHTRFKIGFSVDPFQRLKSFATEIDTAASMQVSCAPADVRRVETILHAWFDIFRLDPALIDDAQGHTEWFDINCWDKVISYLTENHQWLRCSSPAALSTSQYVHQSRREISKRERRQQLPSPAQRQITLNLGGVSSMLDLMTKAEASIGKSIIGKKLTLVGTSSVLDANQQRVFGRLLWEVGALEKRGIVKLNNFDLFSYSFAFTRLSEEPFDTDSLYAIRSVPRAPRRRRKAPEASACPSTSNDDKREGR